MLDQRDLLEALDVAVYTTDAEGRITFYNNAATELWGRKPALDSFWSGSWRLFHPDGQPLAHDQCPMAVALKERRSVRGVEVIAERPDGSRVLYLPHPTPLFDASGKLTGAINLLIDITQDRAIEEARGRLAAIVESSDDPIISETLGSIVTSWNRGAERIFGYTASEMIGNAITKLIPSEMQHEEVDIVSRIARGEHIEHYETVRIAKDGRRLDISLTVSPLRDAWGRIIGASKVARDISQRKQAEETQRLLMHELNHRVKNTLASVDALARQTIRRASSTSDFVSSFSGRIRSLARAHGLLMNTTFQGANLSDLIRDQLCLGDDKDLSISFSGPDVMLDPQAALHLALVLHELGTNARKYGALSAASGRVSIFWTVERDVNRTLILTWRESDGPKVTAPNRAGFGTILIEQSLKPHFGEVTMNFAENGVSCIIKIPQFDPPSFFVAQPKPAMPRPLLGEIKANDAHRSALADKKILVVEDEMLIAMVAADYLDEMGCVVLGPATTVAAALELIAESKIDAALLDGNLAGQRVDEVALALTREGIPFAFVSGYGRDALPTIFREALLLEKPFSLTQPLEALEQLFEPNVSDAAR